MKKWPITHLAEMIVQMRLRSKLTQADVAARMATTQTAIARLERGRLSPSMQTLCNYARANGYCLEIGFVRSSELGDKTGCIFTIQDFGSDEPPCAPLAGRSSLS
jgi:transcriptional regulator with XRE-family HTH domain